MATETLPLSLTEEQAVFLLAAHFWMQVQQTQKFRWAQIVNLLDLALGTAARLDGVDVMNCSSLPKPSLHKDLQSNFLESAPTQHWQNVHVTKLQNGYLEVSGPAYFMVSSAGQDAIHLMLNGDWLSTCFALSARPWLLANGAAVIERLQQYMKPYTIQAKVRTRNMNWVWGPVLFS